MKRRTLIVVSLVVLAATVSIVILYPRARVMPASVWEVPPTPTMTTPPGSPRALPSFYSFPEPRSTPAGEEVGELNAHWAVEGDAARVAIWVFEDETLLDDIDHLFGRGVSHKRIGRYSPTADTSVVRGTIWRRFEWKPN